MIYVYVRRNSDGCTRMYKADHMQPSPEIAAEFKDGVYACDCQRAKFFAWANNEDEPEKGDTCTTDQFSILLMDAAQQIVYMDDSWAPQPAGNPLGVF